MAWCRRSSSVPHTKGRSLKNTDNPSPVAVSSVLPPLQGKRRLQRNEDIGATARLRHLLSTLHGGCCHCPCKTRFRLAGLYREGVEPSGLLRKISELLHLFPLSWDYPDATLALLRRLLLAFVVGRRYGRRQRNLHKFPERLAWTNKQRSYGLSSSCGPAGRFRQIHPQCH